MNLSGEFRRVIKRWSPPPILEAAKRLRNSQTQTQTQTNAKSNTSEPERSPDELALQAFVQRMRTESSTNDQKIWFQSLYRRPSFNLSGSGLSYLNDVFSPLYDIEFVDRHLHDQFKSGADHHAEKYVLDDFYQSKLTEAFSKIGFDPSTARGIRAIDVGSGSGNTVIPILNIFPDIQLIATELSLQMLATLKRRLIKAGHQDRCALLQLNAEELDFHEGTFDFVFGGAILHHMFRPDKTLAGAANILKPGGCAIFFEPFSSGNKLIELMFQTILDRSLAHPIPLPLETYLKCFIDGANTIYGTDKSDPKFQKIDDKWMFPKSYFLEMVKGTQFKSCEIFPLAPTENQFLRQAETILLSYADLKRETIPAWVWDIFREYDQRLSHEQKLDLMIEGCVILKK